MAIKTYKLQSNPATTWLAAGNALFHVVTVPSTGATVNCYSDYLGVNLLASVTPGTSANFSNFGGFYYESNVLSGFTAVCASQKAANITSFTTVATTASETITGQIPIPASVLFSGGILKVKYQVLCNSVTGTPTLAHNLYFGTAGTTADTKLIGAATTAVIANGVGYGEFELVFQAAPSSASAVLGAGAYALAGAPPTALNSATLASTNFNTSSQTYLTLTLQWSASSASNSAVGNMFYCELL